jgi:hypothetical protein
MQVLALGQAAYGETNQAGVSTKLGLPVLLTTGVCRLLYFDRSQNAFETRARLTETAKLESVVDANETWPAKPQPHTQSSPT